MPAITVDDLTVLPRDRAGPAADGPPPGPVGDDRAAAASRARASRSAARSPASTWRDLDPFVHMDQMGEVEYAPGEPKGTPWHPHRGFETVTYIIDGIFDHQDSNGGGGTITNGDTQWMTAGGGILHIETPPECARRQRRPVPRHPAVGQPAQGAEVGAAALPGHPGRARSALLTTADAGALVRVIAGDVDGHAGPGLDATRR